MRRPVAMALIVPPAVLALALPALARDHAVSSDRTATNLSAFGQGLMWSRVAQDGRARLVLRGFGAPTDLAAPPVSGLFDPDLGHDADGSVVAVYARCAGLSGRSCDVYKFDLATSREAKVPGASSGRCSEFAPSIWDGAIAFASSGPSRCDGLFVKGQRGPPLRLVPDVPSDTDIRAGRVAYVETPDSRRSSISIFSIQEGRSTRVITGLRSKGERTRVSYPTFGGSYLYFLFEDLRRHEFKVGRSRARSSSSLQFADRKLPRKADSIAVDGRTLYYTNGRGVFQANDPVPNFVAAH